MKQKTPLEIRAELIRRGHLRPVDDHPPLQHATVTRPIRRASRRRRFREGYDSIITAMNRILDARR